MKVVSFTEARNSLKAVLDRVINDADTTVITRRDSQDAVVMSLDYYNSLMETVHLLRSPANVEHLNKSIAQYRQGKAIQRDYWMSKRLLTWTDEASGGYLYWQIQDKKTLKRINNLIAYVKRSPFEGIGKPEALKEKLSGFWSRRIDDINRLVYAVDDDAITIISCRYHY